MTTRGERYKRQRKATADNRRVSHECRVAFREGARAVIRCNVLVDATEVFHHARLDEQVEKEIRVTSAPLASAPFSRAGRAVVGLSSPADALSNRARSLGQTPIGTLDDRLQLVRDANEKKRRKSAEAPAVANG